MGGRIEEWELSCTRKRGVATRGEIWWEDSWTRTTEDARRAGADPGFFLGGGALVSCSTSTPLNHRVFFLFYFYRIPVVLESRRSSQGGGAHPLHPPPRSAPEEGEENEKIRESEGEKVAEPLPANKKRIEVNKLSPEANTFFQRQGHGQFIAFEVKTERSYRREIPQVAQARNVSIGEHRHCCVTFKRYS